MEIFHKFDGLAEDFEFTRTIYSNVERSEQFLKLNNLSLEVSQTTINK